MSHRQFKCKGIVMCELFIFLLNTEEFMISNLERKATFTIDFLDWNFAKHIEHLERVLPKQPAID